MSTTTEPASLAVYISRFCGYCLRVTRAIDELGAPVEVRNVTSNPELRSDIAAATGRRTVPVLRIAYADGREEWMFESRDIVRYLHERFGQGA